MNGLLHSPEFRSRRLRRLVAPGLAGAALLVGASASAAIVPGQVVLRVGDAPSGGPLVTEIGDPFVNDGGQMGTVAALDDGDHLVLVGGSVVWLGSDAMGPLLFVTEPEMDSTAAGGFVYAPHVDMLDAVWSDAGLLAVAGDPAEGFAPPAVYAFHNRPSMTADGSIYWVAGIDLDGTGDAEIQAFYRSADGMPGGFERLLAGGDMVGFDTIDDAFAGSDGGIDSDYALSEDGAHRIHVLNMEGDSAGDTVLWVDDAIVLREGDPTGDGDAWGNFDLVSINAAGDWLFTGNTDGPPGTDEFLAVNGTIAVREGDMVAGVTLQTSASLRFATLDDQGRVAYAWGYQMAGSFRETLFFSCNAADVANTSVPILTTSADSIDVDGDMVGDFTVDGMLASTDVATRAIGGTDFIYVELELEDRKNTIQAVVEIPVICCGNGVIDPGEDCDDANPDDDDECLSTCVAAECGDGILQTGVEDCDDGNDDDTDECPSTCVPASCGDGFVQDGVEDCDDGNNDDGDDCSADCTIPVAESTSGADTGVDETADTGASASGTGVEPDTGNPLDAGTLDAGSTESETDTDTAGAGGGGEGCSCRTDDRPVTGALGSLVGLLLLGLGRRRPRR
jgi:cysteine-rich repeat protein